MPDDERYPWRYEVLDAFDRPRVVAIGAEQGYVIWDGPRWFRTNPDTGDLITSAWFAACERARDQRRANPR